VVDLDELRDQVGEPSGNQLLISVRGGVRVIGRLVGEVLDEQQIVGPGRVAIDAERQRARLPGRTAYSAVVTTGIYCRPGCGANPLAENVRTFELAASAEAAGFRACLRCRPYRAASPIASGAPELI
jgi:Metal binding domain of Ada